MSNNFLKANYEGDFREAMRQVGIHCIEAINADGQIHRFADNGKGDKDCWYVFMVWLVLLGIGAEIFIRNAPLNQDH